MRGYSRAVCIGDTLYVSGTTATDDRGDVVGAGDPYEQTRYVIGFIKQILTTAGFKMADIVRTRMFVTNIAKWDEYARAHREAFHDIRPASSIVQVARLTDPRLVVEMEIEAVRGCEFIGNVEIKRS